MLGDAILVAPVFRTDGRVRFYVPPGDWTSLLDGSVVSGPSWVEQTHSFDSLPVLVRPGTVLPVGVRRDVPDYHYADGVALHLFGVDVLEAESLRIPGTGELADSTFTVGRLGERLTISRTSGPAVPWSVVLPPGCDAERVTGGRLDGHTMTATGDLIDIQLNRSVRA
jgi:alpha-D-xyloside xylohydrolase